MLVRVFSIPHWHQTINYNVSMLIKLVWEVINLQQQLIS